MLPLLDVLEYEENGQGPQRLGTCMCAVVLSFSQRGVISNAWLSEGDLLWAVFFKTRSLACK